MAKDEDGKTFADDPDFVVQGCPVADGQGPCSTTCGGGWPGTPSTEKLTAAVVAGRINPTRLGCGPLQERATQGLLFLRQKAAEVTVVEASVNIDEAV